MHTPQDEVPSYIHTLPQLSQSKLPFYFIFYFYLSFIFFPFCSCKNQHMVHGE